MASEYLKWKYRDVRPDQPVELTPKQKRANWWHYHKWYVLIGAALVLTAGYLLARALGFGAVKPDYQIAYVGSAALPEDAATALEDALARFGADCSGDGRVVVQLNQYVTGAKGDDAMYAYASSTKLMADLESCDSYFFLLEDPESFQKNYQVLRCLDGSNPDDDDRALHPAVRCIMDRDHRGGFVMKKLLFLFLAVLPLCLSGCSDYPERAADGTDWNKDWTILGSVLGVEEPGDELTLLNNNSILTGDDLYYAAWTVGESTSYTNEDGKEVDLYNAQLYLLLCGCTDSDYAQQTMEEWIQREQETYTVSETRTETCNGQEYTILIYECGSEANPYSRGASAFATCGNYAVSAEFACQDSYSGQAAEVLIRFLDGCHYSAELNE